MKSGRDGSGRGKAGIRRTFLVLSCVFAVAGGGSSAETDLQKEFANSSSGNTSIEVVADETALDPIGNADGSVKASYFINGLGGGGEVSIAGNSHTLTQNSTSGVTDVRLLAILGSDGTPNITITDLFFDSGNRQFEGTGQYPNVAAGGSLISGFDTLSLDNVSFTNGRVHNDNPDGVSNLVNASGGGLLVADGGAAIMTGLHVSGNGVTASTDSTAAFGGGIRVENVGDVFMTDARLTNNHVEINYSQGALATGGGGAASFYDNTGAGTIMSPQPGASTLRLVGGEFSGNSVRGVFAGADGSVSGGGLLVHTGMSMPFFGGYETVAVAGVSILDNTASTDNRGDAVGGGAAFIGNLGEVTLGDASSPTVIRGNAATAALDNAKGGGVYIRDKAPVTTEAMYFSMSNTIVENNTSRSDGGRSQGIAFGGGLAVDGDSAKSTLSIRIGPDVVFRNNHARGVHNKAFGGGVWSNIGLSSVNATFEGNSAEGGDFSGGGAIALTNDNPGFTSDHLTSTITGIFLGNSALASGSTMAFAGASGGAVYFDDAVGSSDLHIEGAYFSGNRAESTSGAATGGAVWAHAGGGALTITGTSTSGVMSDNGASSEQFAGGGALYISDGSGRGNAIDNVVFSGNSAISSQADAAGGALYVGGSADGNDVDVIVTNSTFSGNRAVSSPVGEARGGAIYYADNGLGGNAVSGSVFADNSARDGGAIYASRGGVLDISDTDFLRNAASRSGGAIALDATIHNAVLNLSAIDRDVVLSGNTDATGANAIYFSGVKDASLNLKGERDIFLLDGFGVDLGGGSFTFDVANEGVVTLGGVNSVHVSSMPGGVEDATFSFSSGSTIIFTDDFTTKAVDATRLTIVDGGATYTLNSSRDASLPLFEYDTSKGGSVTLEPGNGTVVFQVNENSALFSFEKEYFLVSDVSQSGGIIPGGDGGQIIQRDDGLWLSLQYEGDAALLADAKSNLLATKSGAFNDAMGKWSLSSVEADSLKANANAAVPGFAMNASRVGLSGMHSAQNAALRFGAGGHGVYANGCCAVEHAVCETEGIAAGTLSRHRGLRFWTGYIGDFDRLDSDGDFNGYKADRHGFVAGVNYDFRNGGTVGFFGGYTNTKTEARDIDAEIKSDAAHFGIIGRFAPLREVKRLTLATDAGATFTRNDSWRSMGGAGRASGDFDQKLFTAGLRFDYDLNFGCRGSITPFLSARYSYLRQDAFNESGMMSATLEQFTGDTFATRLGAKAGYDFTFKGGALSPALFAAWRHEFGDRQFETDAAFNVVTPIRYIQRSSEFARDYAEIGASLRGSFDLGRDRELGVNAGYNVDIAAKNTKHSVYMGFDLGF